MSGIEAPSGKEVESGNRTAQSTLHHATLAIDPAADAISNSQLRQAKASFRHNAT